MKKILTGGLIITLVISVIVLAGIYGSDRQVPENQKLFSVSNGEDVFDIARNLEKQELVKSHLFFEMAVFLRGGLNRLQAGNYYLSQAMSPLTIAGKIMNGDVARKTLVIPEGWTIKNINDYLKAENLIGNDEFSDALSKDYSPDFFFLKDRPDGLGLEGYLFPDTYYLKITDDSEILIRKMLGNLDKKLSPDLKSEIGRQEKTIFEIINMASLLEKEVLNSADKRVVAGILWKRIGLGMYLNVDASLVYALGRKISGLDTKTDFPYNTYKHKGLPPGPISNPGLDSILAAVYPEKTPYLYYLSAPNGETIFSKTLDEHNRAVVKYLK